MKDTVKIMSAYLGLMFCGGVMMTAGTRIGDVVMDKIANNIRTRKERKERKAHERELKKEYFNVKRNES